MTNSNANDAMIRRLQKELEERNSAAQAIISNAQSSERDLNDPEKETLGGLRNRMAQINEQLTELVGRAQSEGDVAACADPALVARGLAAMVDGVAIGMLRDGSRLATQGRLATVRDWLNILRQTG